MALAKLYAEAIVNGDRTYASFETSGQPGDTYQLIFHP